MALLQDTFATRVVGGNSLGTASDSHVWSTARVGTNQALSVGSNEGQDITSSASGNSASRILLGSSQQADVEILLRWATQNAGDNLGVFARWQDSNNWYQYGFDTSGPLIELSKSVAGSFSTFQTLSISSTWVAGTFYWFRVRVQSTRHQLRWWPDGTGEPTNWHLDANDASFGKGGQCGISVRALDTVTPVKFDSFSVDALPSGLTGFVATGTTSPA